MRVDILFPSKYLKAADLNGKQVNVTIAKLVMEDMGFGSEKESKPCLYFEKATKALVLNRTNAMTISGMYGLESDLWVGKRITLFAVNVRAFGQMHETVRVKEDMPPAPKPSPALTGGAGAAVEENNIDDAEDFVDADDDGHNSPPDAPIAPHAPSSPTDAPVGADEAPDPLWDAPAPPRATQAELDALDTVGAAYYGANAWVSKLPALVLAVTTGATSSARELKPTECARLIRKIESLQAAAVQATGQPAANGVAQGVA